MVFCGQMTKWIYIISVWLLLVAGGLFVLLHNHKAVQASPTQKPAISQPKQDPPTRQELLDITNAARKAAGVSELKEDPRLDLSAQTKADDETQYNYVGHVSPHDNLHGYRYVFRAWPECTVASENLKSNASFTNTAPITVNAWLNSPVHREALLNPKDLAVGFGISGTNIVQHFCTQL